MYFFKVIFIYEPTNPTLVTVYDFFFFYCLKFRPVKI